MSLSSRLGTPGIRALLAERVRKPAWSATSIRAPLVAETPSRVGIAFDYALRFGLHARGWADEPDTVAATGVALLARYPELGFDVNVARAIFEEAMSDLIGQSADGFGVEALRACYLLGGLDIVKRARRADQVGRQPTSREIDDLEALLAIVPWEQFRPKSELLLNPTFGEGSRVVGGADADLVLDGTVIELKVLSQLTVPAEAVRQLVGYALLARRYGVDGALPGTPVDRIGVYLARSGVLFTSALNTAIDLTTESEVLDAILAAEET